MLTPVSSEPCIRGHRSTKCTHASERLMVPVKKPGRPLTACPHLQPQSCGCSSITAAIPRKSQCGCGGPSKSATKGPQTATPSTSTTESSSPAARDFKVKKPTQPKSRKQSIDVNVLSRVDPNSVNVIPFAPRPQQRIAPALPNGAKPAVPLAPYTDKSQTTAYQQIQPPLPYSANSSYVSVNGNAVYPVSNGNGVHRSFVTADQIPDSMLSSRSNSNDSSCCAPANAVKVEYEQRESEQPSSSCCSKPSLDAPLDGMIFANGNPMPTMQNYTYVPTYPISTPLYPFPQPTLFAYPPSYGSHQNPLQPASWRHSVANNMYAAPADIPLYPLQGPDLDMALHSCGCGPTCQCVGCAAHPYNDATQEYVRSAYAESVSPHEAYAPIYPPPVFASDSAVPEVATGSTNGTSRHESPRSEGGSTGEEQALSPSDFFFVSYPINGDGCGGDTTSCPCGDGCQCLGCTIHSLDQIGNGVNGQSEREKAVLPAPVVDAEKETQPVAEVATGVKKSCCS